MRASIFLFFWTVLAATAGTPPSAPEQVAKDFFAYLSADNTNIFSDAAAQERFLSTPLRQALDARLRYERRHPTKPGEIPTSLDNSAFLLAWDPPKRFVVTRTVQSPYTAIVAGRCIWLAGQEYAHEVRPTFFVLVLEPGGWRVSDIQAAKSKFNPDMSLSHDMASPFK
jgi:hypothetical protein